MSTKIDLREIDHCISSSSSSFTLDHNNDQNNYDNDEYEDGNNCREEIDGKYHMQKKDPNTSWCPMTNSSQLTNNHCGYSSSLNHSNKNHHLLTNCDSDSLRNTMDCNINVPSFTNPIRQRNQSQNFTMNNRTCERMANNSTIHFNDGRSSSPMEDPNILKSPSLCYFTDPESGRLAEQHILRTHLATPQVAVNYFYQPRNSSISFESEFLFRPQQVSPNLFQTSHDNGGPTKIMREKTNETFLSSNIASTMYQMNSDFARFYERNHCQFKQEPMSRSHPITDNRRNYYPSLSSSPFTQNIRLLDPNWPGSTMGPIDTNMHHPHNHQIHPKHYQDAPLIPSMQHQSTIGFKDKNLDVSQHLLHNGYGAKYKSEGSLTSENYSSIKYQDDMNHLHRRPLSSTSSSFITNSSPSISSCSSGSLSSSISSCSSSPLYASYDLVNRSKCIKNGPSNFVLDSPHFNQIQYYGSRSMTKNWPCDLTNNNINYYGHKGKNLANDHNYKDDMSMNKMMMMRRQIGSSVIKNEIPDRNPRLPLQQQQNHHHQNKVKKSKEHIKRPMNAFMVWARNQRQIIAQENGELKNSDISKILGKKWREMDDEQRRPFKERAAQIVEEHLRQHPNYKYKPRRRLRTTNKLIMWNDTTRSDSLDVKSKAKLSLVNKNDPNSDSNELDSHILKKSQSNSNHKSISSRPQSYSTLTYCGTLSDALSNVNDDLNLTKNTKDTFTDIDVLEFGIDNKSEWRRCKIPQDGSFVHKSTLQTEYSYHNSLRPKNIEISNGRFASKSYNLSTKAYSAINNRNSMSKSMKQYDDSDQNEEEESTTNCFRSLLICWIVN